MIFARTIKVPVEVSARHVHLSRKDMDALFGRNSELTNIKQLSQPSDFASEETVDIQVGSRRFEKVRVVGPLREKTQVEVSLTDAVGSGVTPPVMLSGELENSSLAVITGPAGRIELAEGLIVALRHIHCATSEAKKLGLKDGAMVSVAVGGKRPVVFKNVSLRVKDDYKLCMHVDTDEGNAAGINKIGEGIIIK